jgi:hypothetical protein
VLLNIAALTFIKLSCIFVYKRIFAKGSNITVTTIIWTINAIILLWGIGYFFAFLFGCGTHFNDFWTNIENQLKCPADLAMIQKSLAMSDVIMDGIILIFPILLVSAKKALVSRYMLMISDHEAADVQQEQICRCSYLCSRCTVSSKS